MIVNLECVDCGFVFDSELGNLRMNHVGTLIYDIKPVCPNCHAFDKVYMTKRGTQQLDQWFMDYLKQRKN